GQQVLHTQLLGDLLRRLGGVLVLSSAAAGDYPEPRQLGQLASHLVGDTVGEVLIGGVTQILERKNREAAGAGRSARWFRVASSPGEQDSQADGEAEDHGNQSKGEPASGSGLACGSSLDCRHRGRRDGGAGGGNGGRCRCQ